MTTTYSCLGQVDAPPILKWGHSALYESWFKSPWFAIESAYELARKLGTHEEGRIRFCSSTITSCGKRRSVRFAEDVDLNFFIRILFAVPLFEFRQSHCVIGMHRAVLTAPMFARPERLLLLINCLGPIFLILKLGLLCDPLKICQLISNPIHAPLWNRCLVRPC